VTRETDGLVLTDEFRHALELLAGGRHLFLTGKAGTGKSTLIRRFMVETDRAVVVVAPTGIAALVFEPRRRWTMSVAAAIGRAASPRRWHRCRR
jgi:tRNA A37 threonylcarbamoyladenosine biosynthesis protein TsaE